MKTKGEQRFEVHDELASFSTFPNLIVSDKRVSRQALLVYIVLSTFKNQKTSKCWPSLRTLVTRSRCGKAKVVEAINELVRLGYIHKETKVDPRNPKRHFSNRYILLAQTAEKEKAVLAEQQVGRSAQNQVVLCDTKGGSVEGQELDELNYTKRTRRNREEEKSMRKLGSLRLPPTLLGSRYGLSQERKNLLTGSPYNLTEEQIPILLDLIKERMIVSDDKEGHPPNNQEALYILVDTYLDWFDREYLENEIPASAYGLIRDALTEGWDISEEACAKHWENRFAEEYYDLKNAVEG